MKAHEPTIFLDLDGVCAAWSETVYKMWDHTPKPGKRPYYVEESIGTTDDEVWDKIYALGTDWWANLPEYTWSRELYRSLKKVAHVVFLTSPCRRGYSAMGKTQWMRTFTRKPGFREYIITEQKFQLARPNAVLVDDSDAKIDSFREYGGKGVLFPRPWNTGPDIADGGLVTYTVDAVRRELGLTEASHQ